MTEHTAQPSPGELFAEVVREMQFEFTYDEMQTWESSPTEGWSSEDYGVGEI